MGTIKIPPAIPSIPPSALAPNDTANSHIANPLFISSISGSQPCCCTPGQSSHEPDLIATVIQFFVIDRPLTCAIRCTLNEKDGTANIYAQRPCNNSICRYRSEEHTSELQSLAYLVCRLLLEKKNKKKKYNIISLKNNKKQIII